MLFERTGRKPGQLVGRSPWLQPVVVDAPRGLIGSIVRVRVTGTGSNSLFAELDDPGLRGAANVATLDTQALA